MIGGEARDQLGAGLTRYQAPLGGGTLHATEVRPRQFMPYAATVKNLKVHTQNAPGAGETYTFTLMVNGIGVALTAQITNPNTEAEDITNVVELEVDDSITLRIVSTGGAAATFFTWMAEINES